MWQRFSPRIDLLLITPMLHLFFFIERLIPYFSHFMFDIVLGQAAPSQIFRSILFEEADASCSKPHNQDRIPQPDIHKYLHEEISIDKSMCIFHIRLHVYIYVTYMYIYR